MAGKAVGGAAPVKTGKAAKVGGAKRARPASRPSARANGHGRPPNIRIGAKLRAARQRKGMTVRGLARYAGVSPSLISQVERGRVMPSVGTLYSIANELDLNVDDLFRDGQTKQAAEPDRDEHTRRALDPVLRQKSRKVIRLAGNVRWERLTPTPDRELEFLYVVYEAGASSCPEEALIRHGGTEYAYMISGRLGVKIGFEAFELGPGDAITWDAQMPHRLWTVGDEPAVAIWVVLNRQGDIRADPAD